MQKLRYLIVLLSFISCCFVSADEALDERDNPYNKTAPIADISIELKDFCVSANPADFGTLKITYDAMKEGETGTITLKQIVENGVNFKPGSYKLFDSANNELTMNGNGLTFAADATGKLELKVQGLTASAKNHLIFEASITVVNEDGTDGDSATDPSTISDCEGTVEFCYDGTERKYFPTGGEVCYPIQYDYGQKKLRFKVRQLKALPEGAHYQLRFGSTPAQAVVPDKEGFICVEVPEPEDDGTLKIDSTPKMTVYITLYHFEGTEGSKEEICYELCPTGGSSTSNLDDSSESDSERCPDPGGCATAATGEEICIENGTSTGSLQFSESLALFPNEPMLTSGRLMAYRSYINSDNKLNVENLYYASPLTMKIVSESVPRKLVSESAPVQSSALRKDVTEYEVSIRQASGFYLTFAVEDGQSIGYPKGQYEFSNARIEFLDSTGASTSVVGDATHVKHYRAGGSVVIYERSTGNAVRFITREGRVTELPDARLDIIRAGAVIRQVKTEAGLLDVIKVNDSEFEVRHYLPWQIGAKADGVYTLNGTPQRTVNVKTIAENRVRFTRVFGTRREVKESIMTKRENGTSWETNRIEDGEVILSERRINVQPDLGFGQDEGEEARSGIFGKAHGYFGTPQSLWTNSRKDKERYTLRTWSVPGEDKPVIRSKFIEYYKAPWGGQVPTRSLVYETSDRSQAPIERRFSYFTDEDQTGSYGRLKSHTISDGTENSYTYDNLGRLTSTTSAYLDNLTGKVVSYDYSPHVAADTAPLDDFRPRTTTVTCEGNVVQKTFFAAYFEPTTGEYTEVSEIAHSQNATYGDPANYRSTTIFYAPTAGFAKAGRVKKSIRVDGVVTLFDYVTGGTDDTLTVIATGSLQSDESPLAGYSVRSTGVFDSRGALKAAESAAYVIDRENGDQAVWQNLVRHEQTYNIHGYPVKTEEVDSQSGRRRVLEECTWINGQKRVVVDAVGVKTYIDFDDHYRVTRIRRGGIPAVGEYEAQEEIETSISGSSMMNGSSVGWMDTNVQVQAGDITLNSVQLRDYRGRVNYSRDENGYVSTAVYNRTGTVADITAPNTGTVKSVRYLDGRIKSETGTALVDCFYQFGIEADGSTTVRKSLLSENNARYVECLTNMLGQTVSCKKPGFNGSLVTNTTRYEVGTGRVLGSSSDAANTPNSAVIYNSIGVPVRTGISIDNDTLELASSDRIVDVEQGLEKDAAGIWAFSRTYVYPTDGNGQRKLIGSSRSKASNFTGLDIAAMESTDIASNTSTAYGTLNRATGITEVFSQTPGVASQGVATSRYGRLETTATPGESKLALVQYDALGRAVATKEPRKLNWATVQFVPNSTQVRSITNARGDSTQFHYYGNNEIGAGRVQRTVLPDQTQQFTTYTVLGNVQSQRGAQLDTRFYQYDAYNQLSKLFTWKQEPSAGTALADQLSSAVSTTWNYEDATGLLLSRRYADGQGPDYTYDTAGRTLTKVAAREVAPGMRLTTSYGYTAWGEHLTTSYNDSVTQAVQHHYDRLGRMTHSVQGLTAGEQTRVTTSTYDPATLLQTEQRVRDGIFINDLAANYLQSGSVSFDKTLTSGFDNLLRAASIKVNHGVDYHLDYQYGNEGRLSQIVNQLTNKSFGYNYHPDSRNLITELTAPVHKVVNEYEDNRDVLKTKTNQWAGLNNGNEGDHVSKFAYTVNSIGQRTQAILSGKAIENNGRANTTITWDWQYSLRGKLTNAAATSDGGVASITRTFGHDAIGNRVQHSNEFGSFLYASNALNQYSSITTVPTTGQQETVTPEIDKDGNVTNNGDQHYVFDAEDRLIEVRDQSNTLLVSYRYDAYSRRIERKVPNGETRQFFYNGWNVVAEYVQTHDSLWQLDQTLTWGLDVSGSEQGAGGIGGLLATTDHSEIATTYYPLYDGSGNITEYVDGSQNIVAHYEYSPFGQVLHSHGDKANDFSYRFSTKPVDSISGLYYYGYRWYDAKLGRWINRDPIKEDGGLNVYDFCGGDPINCYDYLGNERQWHHIIPWAIAYRFESLIDINAPKWGLMMNPREHAALHKAGWNDAWEEFFYSNSKNGKCKLTEADVDEFYKKLKKDPRFANLLKTGKVAKDRYPSEKTRAKPIPYRNDAAYRKQLRSKYWFATLRNRARSLGRGLGTLGRRMSGPLGIVITFFTFTADCRAEGVWGATENAINEQLWFVSWTWSAEGAGLRNFVGDAASGFLDALIGLFEKPEPPAVREPIVGMQVAARPNGPTNYRSFKMQGFPKGVKIPFNYEVMPKAKLQMDAMVEAMKEGEMYRTREVTLENGRCTNTEATYIKKDGKLQLFAGPKVHKNVGWGVTEDGYFFMN